MSIKQLSCRTLVRSIVLVTSLLAIWLFAGAIVVIMLKSWGLLA